MRKEAIKKYNLYMLRELVRNRIGIDYRLCNRKYNLGDFSFGDLTSNRKLEMKIKIEISTHIN